MQLRACHQKLVDAGQVSLARAAPICQRSALAPRFWLQGILSSQLPVYRSSTGLFRSPARMRSVAATVSSSRAKRNASAVIGSTTAEAARPGTITAFFGNCFKAFRVRTAETWSQGVPHIGAEICATEDGGDNSILLPWSLQQLQVWISWVPVQVTG